MLLTSSSSRAMNPLRAGRGGGLPRGGGAVRQLRGGGGGGIRDGGWSKRPKVLRDILEMQRDEAETPAAEEAPAEEAPAAENMSSLLQETAAAFQEEPEGLHAAR